MAQVWLAYATESEHNSSCADVLATAAEAQAFVAECCRGWADKTLAEDDAEAIDEFYDEWDGDWAVTQKTLPSNPKVTLDQKELEFLIVSLVEGASVVSKKDRMALVAKLEALKS